MAGDTVNHPPLPWKARLKFALLTAVTDAAVRKDGTVNRRLLNFFDPPASPNPSPVHGVRTADFPLYTSTSPFLRVFAPAAAAAGASLPIVVFFHGGGFVFLSAASRIYDDVCRRLARELGAVVVSVDYRLAPEHRFPAAYDDAAAALRWLDGDPTCAGFAPAADPSRVFLAGDSAGANIVHHLAVTSLSELQSLRAVGVVLIQPFFGGEERTASEVRLTGAPVVTVARSDRMWKAFLPTGSDRNHPAAGPWRGEEEEEWCKYYPPAMVVVGGRDPLQDWQRRYAAWVKEKVKGEVRVVEYEHGVHGFYIFPELAETPLLMAELKAFVDMHSGRSSSAA